MLFIMPSWKQVNEVNELRAKRLARTANPITLVAQQQPVYHPQNHPNHSLKIPQPDHNQLLTETEEKDIDKLMALISLSFKKIYKPTNNNLRTSSNTSRANQDNTLRINIGTGDDTDDEPNDQELEAHYMYMAQIQEVTLDAADNFRPIFDTEPLQKVQYDDDNYNVFANDREHPEQPEYVNDTYLEEQGDTNITIDSLDMSINEEMVDQDDYDLAKERDLLASLIDKLECEIDDNKNHNKLLESSNKTLADKLNGEIKDFKTKNKSLESSNNHFKEANNELSKTNQLMFKDLKKFQAKLDSYVKPEFIKKAQRVNPRLYDIGCYNDNLALMLALESDEIHLKAELQDKDIAISDLKKVIEKMKGKSVETKFENPSVIRQPNAFKSQRQSILGKPATFSDSLAKKDFSKSKSVTINNMSNDFSKPVTAQILPQNVNSIVKNTNMIAPGMYKMHTRPDQTITPQLPQDIRKTNKHVSFSTRVIPTTSASRPKFKCNQLEDRVMPNNSHGKMKEVEDHHRNFKFSKNKTSITACTDSLNAKTSNVNFACVTCGKCVLNDNHDMCVLHYINGVNSRTKMPMDVPISTREPKRTVNQYFETSLKRIVASESTNLEAKLGSNMSRLVRHVNGGTVKFRNDQIALILGYGDLVQGNITIKRVYYVEGLNHNLFSVGQFCYVDLDSLLSEVYTCFGSDLRKVKMIFSQYDIVTGLPKLKFIKDHLCSSCELGKPNRKSFKTKNTPSSKRRLQILHMDLCGPMRVESFNDETPEVLIDFLKLVQRGLHAQGILLSQELTGSDLVPQCPTTALEHASISPGHQSQENVPHTVEIVTTLNELDLLFSLMFDELLNGTTPVVSKSSSVTATDAPNQRQQ
ncbi:hypothetical protein Tco_1503394 [Tanacetum coccineum]